MELCADVVYGWRLPKKFRWPSEQRKFKGDPYPPEWDHPSGPGEIHFGFFSGTGFFDEDYASASIGICVAKMEGNTVAEFAPSLFDQQHLDSLLEAKRETVEATTGIKFSEKPRVILSLSYLG